MACSQQDAAETPAAGLPAGVLAAFHDHLDRISGGALVCRDGDIAAAATVSGDINADRRPDYVVDTRSLNCQARRDGPAVAYFCGTGSCAFLTSATHPAAESRRPPSAAEAAIMLCLQ